MDLGGVSTLLKKTRQDADVYSKEDKTQPLFTKALGIAICRCDQAFTLVQKCIDSGLISDECKVEKPAGALKIAESVSKIMENDGTINEEETKDATNTFNEISRELSNFVSEKYVWLMEKFDYWEEAKLHTDLCAPSEAKLWWLGTFGNVQVIPWGTFWAGFSKYMDIVYGFPLESSDYQDDAELGIKCCLQKIALDKDAKEIVWNELDDTAVSAENFRLFYQRFGPWETLYTKSLTLIDVYNGHPHEIFYPTSSRKMGVMFLKTKGITREEKNRDFVIRFSRKAGSLVYQSIAKEDLNILITNTPTGYYVETVTGKYTDMRDVPAALKVGWLMEFDDSSSAKVWRNRLTDLGISADTYGVLVSPGAEKEEHFKYVEKKSDDGDKPHYGLLASKNSAEESQGSDEEQVIPDIPADQKKVQPNNAPHRDILENAEIGEPREPGQGDEEKIVLDEESGEEAGPAVIHSPGPAGDKACDQEGDLAADQEAEAKNVQENVDLLLTVKGLKAEGLKRKVKTLVQIIPYSVTGNPLGMKETHFVKADTDPHFPETKSWNPKCLIGNIQFMVLEHSYVKSNKMMCKCDLSVHDNFKDGMFSFNDSVQLTTNDNKPAGKLNIQVDCCEQNENK